MKVYNFDVKAAVQKYHKIQGQVFIPGFPSDNFIAKVGFLLANMFPKELVSQDLRRKVRIAATNFDDLLEEGRSEGYIRHKFEASLGYGELKAFGYKNPSYPRVTCEYKLHNLIHGYSPVEISLGLLTKREAHQWLKAGAPDLGSWVISQIPEKFRNLMEEVDFDWVDEDLALWLRDRLKIKSQRQALVKVRTLPDGDKFRIIEMFYHLEYEHLTEGRETPVMKVWENFVNSQKLQALSSYPSLDYVLSEPPPWYKSVPGVEILNTPGKLFNEGIEMRHCASTMSSEVERKEAVVFSLKTETSRSTVDLTWDGSELVQHFAACNKEPAKECKELLAKALKEWGLSPLDLTKIFG